MSVDKDILFEKKLRQAKPVPVDEFMAERVAVRIREIESEKRTPGWTSYMGWAGLVAAATIMVVVGLSLFTQTIKPTEEAAIAVAEPSPLKVPALGLDDEAFKPVLAQNNLKERIDEGIVFLDGGLTARKYRYQFIDRVVWRNPANGAQVEMEVPRDEVVLIPVQTY